MSLFVSKYDGAVDVDSDDDDGNDDSSDDEIQIFLHGTPEQKRKMRRLSLGQKSSSEDEFEKEMDASVSQSITNMQQANNFSIPSGSSSKDRQFYDKDYFDSDSDDDMSNQGKNKRQHPVISNDDLLYDPGEDDDNERWVRDQRQSYQPRSKPKTGASQSNKPQKLPSSDAVLNCPACMSLLCLDCQRHSLYKNQYRAMFVTNCEVDTTQRLKFPKNDSKNKRKKKSQNSAQNSTIETDTEELYNPVKCAVCTTEVGVYDSDEVYHFFNVLSSY